MDVRGSRFKHPKEYSLRDPSPTTTEPEADFQWDAGEMGCGELLLDLRFRLREMRPGQTIKVTALDPGAPEDLPAWCRLTGHRLIWRLDPVYIIQRKEN